MGKIKAALSPKQTQFERRAEVRKRVEVTARRGVLDLETLEWIAKSYNVQTHKAARRYAFRLVALWRAGHFNQSIAAGGSWTALEEKTKSLWFDDEGQVLTRQSREEETEKKLTENRKIRREREVLGAICGALLPNGAACKNLKMLGASRCYRHGGKEQLAAKGAREGVE